MSRLMIMAGGTGGHVIPALSVARELSRRSVEVSWVGSHEGLEARLVPGAGIPFDTITIRGLRRSGIARKLFMPFMLGRAMLQVWRIIRRRKPDAFLGMGGFVSGPGGLVAVLLGLPLILHEQNSVAGLTNRVLSRWSRVVLGGFPKVRGIPGVVWSGNPVRPGIVGIDEPAKRLSGERSGMRILVIGGSQGARVFNRHLADLLAPAQVPGIEVWHQCGAGNAADIQARYDAAGIRCRAEDFIEDMDEAYAWSDVVVCRSGAMTVSEICCAGAVAIFVPFPGAVNDHQASNAGFLVDEQAALLVRQPEFLEGGWVQFLKRFAADREVLVHMGERARKLARPDATGRVADTCVEVLHA